MSNWIAGNYFLNETQMQNNAKIIYNVLATEGWSKNAIFAVLANMEAESTINPGIWENLSYGNMSGGYGLVQWTPASKYINWAGSDWETNYDKQISRLFYELATPGSQWVLRSPYAGWSFSDFAYSTADAYTLACVFAWNYEGSATVLWGTDSEKEALKQYRGNLAIKWANFFDNYGGDVPPLGIPKWLLFKLKQRSGLYL